MLYVRRSCHSSGNRLTGTSAEDSSEQGDRQSEFERLMTCNSHEGSPGHDDRPADTIYHHEYPSLQLALSLGLSPLLSGNNASLCWHLTNGPLAGMVINAVSSATGIAIALSAVTLDQLQRVTGGVADLEKTLCQRFGYAIKIEVNDENTSI